MQTLNKLAVVFLCIFSMFLHAEQVISGVSILPIQGKINDEMQQQGIKEALANGVRQYFSENEPGYLPFFTKHTTQKQIVKRIFELVGKYQVIEQSKENGMLSTEVRAILKVEQLKQRLAKFSTIKRVTNDTQRSQFAFVFLARVKSDNGYKHLEISSDIEAPIQKVFIQNGYKVLSNHQFERLTGNAFNHSLMEQNFVRDGSVDWDKASLAAYMTAELGSNLYTVVGTFEIEEEERNEFEPDLQTISIRAFGQVNDITNDNVGTSASFEKKFQGLSYSTLIHEALHEAGQQIATQLNNSLISNEIF
ncbi:hypothetical protein [uncultured Paraglaciecola sp.]|uniref:hypothetical protein n=1 Tax=uncultured Paraglaciecola sp. TaxID=1765024 RepID=UPI0026080DA0|nr:hypothetical protein [uncultured Paraglaciecola sp.]